MRGSIALAVIFGTCLVGASTAGGRISLSCDRSGETLKRTSELRVFSYARQVGGSERQRYIYACSRSSNSVHALTAASNVRHVAGAGAYVAVDMRVMRREVEDGIYSFSLVVFRPDRHQSERYYDPGPATAPKPYPGDPRRLGPSDLVLTSDGRAAFIERWQWPDGSTTLDVVRTRPMRRDAGNHSMGEAEVVDSGPDVDPTSLRLAGRTMKWDRAGITYSAPI